MKRFGKGKAGWGFLLVLTVIFFFNFFFFYNKEQNLKRKNDVSTCKEREFCIFIRERKTYFFKKKWEKLKQTSHWHWRQSKESNQRANRSLFKENQLTHSLRFDILWNEVLLIFTDLLGLTFSSLKGKQKLVANTWQIQLYTAAYKENINNYIAIKQPLVNFKHTTGPANLIQLLFFFLIFFTLSASMAFICGCIYSVYGCMHIIEIIKCT